MAISTEELRERLEEKFNSEKLLDVLKYFDAICEFANEDSLRNNILKLHLQINQFFDGMNKNKNEIFELADDIDSTFYEIQHNAEKGLAILNKLTSICNEGYSGEDFDDEEEADDLLDDELD